MVFNILNKISRLMNIYFKLFCIDKIYFVHHDYHRTKLVFCDYKLGALFSIDFNPQNN